MNNKVIVIIFATFALTGSACNAKQMPVANEDSPITDKNMKTETATFGGGCFWCTEAMYSRLNGVISATSGYSGGQTKNPTYKDVCTGTTGHAEVIQVVYQPDIITYTELLEIFFKTHNPTTVNRQGEDVGTQYRSVVLYHSEEQKKIAVQLIEELNQAKIWDDPLVTQVVPFEIFYAAEAYHQDYFDNNTGQMYCKMVIVPKVEKFEKLFKDKLKKK